MRNKTEKLIGKNSNLNSHGRKIKENLRHLTFEQSG
jgi:hypothetical protein